MNRRQFLIRAALLSATSVLATRAISGDMKMDNKMATITKITKSDEEWKKLLTPQQYNILREAGTERPHSSPLNKEKREGTYVCAGCDLPLFTSDMKYDSGTGWPSFYTSLPGALETELDFKLIYPRTEYHCARCGGHHGHIFKDGPKPTGKRWCNNGLALKFIPKSNG